MKFSFALLFFFFLNVFISYGQKIDSTLFSKKFIKANISANIPFDGQKITSNLHSISFFFTTKNSFSHEFGFISASYDHFDNGNSTRTQADLLTYYQFSYIFLKKFRIRPYISFKSQPQWYFSSSRTNIQVLYERGNTAFGLQHRNSLSPGTLIIINKYLILDLSVNLYSFLFIVDNGYRGSFTKNPGVPADQQNVAQPWLDYTFPVNLKPQNGIYLQIGLVVKLEK